MFNFIQHLFTARALEKEITELKLKVENLETEKKQLADELAKANDTIYKLKNQNKAGRPKFAQSDYDPFKT